MRTSHAALLARQFVTVGAVAVTGFPPGWQATGIAGGAIVAVASAPASARRSSAAAASPPSAGVCPAVFRRREVPQRRSVRNVTGPEREPALEQPVRIR
jgi:hypothetical protein